MSYEENAPRGGDIRFAEWLLVLDPSREPVRAVRNQCVAGWVHPGCR
jgi:hypothetical protein